MIDLHKSVALSLLMTLAVLPSWQVVEAADGVRSRHSLIHRPQIQSAPALSAAQSQPQSASPSLSRPSQPVHRKVVKRPMASTSPLAVVDPMASGNSAQTDPPPAASQSDHLGDAPPEPEMIPMPEPPEPPHTESQ